MTRWVKNLALAKVKILMPFQVIVILKFRATGFFFLYKFKQEGNLIFNVESSIYNIRFQWPERNLRFWLNWRSSDKKMRLCFTIFLNYSDWTSAWRILTKSPCISCKSFKLFCAADMSPAVLAELVIRISSTRLRLVVADAIFRNFCCRNGLTVGDDVLSLKKMVSMPCLFIDAIR